MCSFVLFYYLLGHLTQQCLGLEIWEQNQKHCLLLLGVYGSRKKGFFSGPTLERGNFTKA